MPYYCQVTKSYQSQPHINPHLLELLEDAEKFVFSHRSIIERAPLQIYGSALVFSPTLSEIRKRYWKERLSFIEITAGIRDHWGAHRQTLDAVSACGFIFLTTGGASSYCGGRGARGHWNVQHFITNPQSGVRRPSGVEVGFVTATAGWRLVSCDPDSNPEMSSIL